MDLLLTIWLLVIIASSVMVGFTSGRIIEMRRTERILRYMMDEAVNQMSVTPHEGETNDEP